MKSGTDLLASHLQYANITDSNSRWCRSTHLVQIYSCTLTLSKERTCLGQIRYDKGNMAAKYEEIRGVLSRENMI